MMKTPKSLIAAAKTKAQIREQLAREMQDFLATGGEVTDVPRGVSGQSCPGRGFHEAINIDPRQPRTAIPEVTQAMEARRKPSKEPPKKSHRRAKKRLITDDFGEPVRWVWEE